MTEATPRPWKFVPWHIEEGASAVRSGTSPAAHIVCTTASDADAELIARAVNTYDERDALLREAAHVLELCAAVVPEPLLPTSCAASIRKALGETA